VEQEPHGNLLVQGSLKDSAMNSLSCQKNIEGKEEFVLIIKMPGCDQLLRQYCSMKWCPEQLDNLFPVY